MAVQGKVIATVFPVMVEVAVIGVPTNWHDEFTAPTWARKLPDEGCETWAM